LSKTFYNYHKANSQTCIKRSPLRQRKSGLLRQVRFNSFILNFLWQDKKIKVTA